MCTSPSGLLGRAASLAITGLLLGACGASSSEDGDRSSAQAGDSTVSAEDTADESGRADSPGSTHVSPTDTTDLPLPTGTGVGEDSGHPTETSGGDPDSTGGGDEATDSAEPSEGDTDDGGTVSDGTSGSGSDSGGTTGTATDPPVPLPPFEPSLQPVFENTPTGPFGSIGGVRAGPPRADGSRVLFLTTGVEVPLASISIEDPAGAFVAIDGATNEILWSTSFPGELFTMGQFVADGESVLVGGRAGSFGLLDTASGDDLWMVDLDHFIDTPVPYNFYTPVVPEGLTVDGEPVLIQTYGGNDLLLPHEPRSPGYIAVMSLADGRLIRHEESPDGAEIYASPVLLPSADGGEPRIVTGTGGETHGGGLWVGAVSSVVNGTFSSQAVRVAVSDDKGFIAPPALADLTGDGQLDIVATAVDGRTIAISGTTLQELWTDTLPGSETFATPAVLPLPDGSIGIFVQHSLGVFPQYSGTVARLLDGSTGDLLWTSETDAFIGLSPVAVDLQGHGYASVLFVQVFADTSGGFFSELTIMDPGNEHVFRHTFDGPMLTTPFIGDANGDGMLELIGVISGGFNPAVPATRQSMDWTLARLSLDAPVPEFISWGGYMGTASNSHYTPPSGE